MIPSIYLNLEDDVAKIAVRMKKEKSSRIVLVCPKRCFLFSDELNLVLLKKQADALGKTAAILTMDEKGKNLALAAGFELKEMSFAGARPAVSDIMRKTAENSGQKKVPGFQAKTPFTEGAGKTAGFAMKKNPELPEEPQREKRARVDKIPTPASQRLKPVIFPVMGQSNKDVSGQIPPKKRHFFSLAAAGFFIFAALCALFAYVYFLPSAKVEIFPKSEMIVRDMDIKAFLDAGQPNAETLSLPSSAVSDTVSAQGSFESTGKKEVGNKASGTVKIYNFSGAPISLKAGTTFLAIGEKKYLLSSDINYHQPAKYINEKEKEVDPQSLGQSFETVAAEGGEGYNVPAGTRLEITNQAFGARPQVLYARNDTAITGGTSRYLSFVSEQDLANAQKTLLDRMVSDLKNKLKNESLVIPDGAYKAELAGFASDKPAGTESPRFEAEMQVKIIGVGINESDLKKMIYGRVEASLGKNKELEEQKNVDISYFARESDLQAGNIAISAHFEGISYYQFAADGLKEQLKGKNPELAGKILKSRGEISSYEISLSPSWQKDFPYFSSKIDIKVTKK